jgi:hypothetical protein
VPSFLPRASREAADRRYPTESRNTGDLPAPGGSLERHPLSLEPGSVNRRRAGAGAADFHLLDSRALEGAQQLRAGDRKNQPDSVLARRPAGALARREDEPVNCRWLAAVSCAHAAVPSPLACARR